MGLKLFPYSEFVIDTNDYCDGLDYSVFYRKPLVKVGVKVGVVCFLLALIGDYESLYLRVDYLDVLLEWFFSSLDIFNLYGVD